MERLHGSVLRSGGFQLAFDEMKLSRAQGTECLSALFLDRLKQFWRDARRLKPRQGQVRREGAFFEGEAEGVRGLIDFLGKRFQVRGRFHAGPEDARAFLMREKAETAKFEIHRSGGNERRRARFAVGLISRIAFLPEISA